MSSGGHQLSKEDARAVVRLLGEVTASRENMPAKRWRLMDGICRLVDGDCWTWALGFDLRPDSLPTWVLQLHGGFDEARLAAMARAQEHPDLAALTAPFAALLMEKKTHITRMRQQTDPEDRFRTSGAYPLWEAADVAPGIMSSRPVDATTVSAVSIHRRMDAPLFTERELRIAHILLTEVDWLHPKARAQEDSVIVPALTPRRRTIFMLLVQGYSRERIAEHLGVSIHTANEHVKGIYRHFGVHSQPELIHRFTNGDGGDAGRAVERFS